MRFVLLGILEYPNEAGLQESWAQDFAQAKPLINSTRPANYYIISGMFSADRLEREARTLQAMFVLYCRGLHGSRDALCQGCRELQAYALNRLRNCPFQQGKTTCAKCPIHCYQPRMRAKIKGVMRFAGPRMLFRHPLLTLQHYLDSLQKEPKKNATKPN